MKSLIAAVVTFAALCFTAAPAIKQPHITSVAIPGVPPTAAITESLPQAAVHFAVSDAGYCSAFAIAFERAVTSAHCAEMDRVVTKDGIVHRVYNVKMSSNSDIAILYVERLFCPCLPYSTEAPAKGEELMIIGYPWGVYKPDIRLKMMEISSLREGLKGWLGVKDKDIDKWLAEDKSMWLPGFIEGAAILATEGSRPGHSGGPMLVKRNGEWVAVGVISFWLADPFAGPMVTGAALIGASDLFSIR